MWEEISQELTNIVAGKWYMTALYTQGDYQCVQTLKHEGGVWWRKDGSFTDELPSHVWVVG